MVRERQVAQFIEHDRVLVEHPVGQARGAAPELFRIALVDQVVAVIEPRTHALQYSLASERGGEVGLARARAAGEHDVARGSQILSGVELMDLRFV